MTRPNSSEIIVVLDRSGSMACIKSDMEGGFSSFLAEQKKVSGDCRVSLFQFSDGFEEVYTALPVHDVPPLRIVPHGMTALYDAVGRAITSTGDRLARVPEWNRPAKVIFVVITDGAENSSCEYSQDRIKAMIKHQEESYSWGFIYLGSSPTTQVDANSIGIHAVSNYVATGEGVYAMNSVIGASVASYRNAGPEAVLRAFIPQNVAENAPPPSAPAPSFFAKP